MLATVCPCILCPVKIVANSQGKRVFFALPFLPWNSFLKTCVYGRMGKQPAGKVGKHVVDCQLVTVCLKTRHTTCFALTVWTSLPPICVINITTSSVRIISCKVARVPFAIPLATSSFVFTMYGVFMTQYRLPAPFNCLLLRFRIHCSSCGPKGFFIFRRPLYSCFNYENSPWSPILVSCYDWLHWRYRVCTKISWATPARRWEEM